MFVANVLALVFLLNLINALIHFYHIQLNYQDHYDLVCWYYPTFRGMKMRKTTYKTFVENSVKLDWTLFLIYQTSL